jgi:hypothetical protein
MWSCFVHITVWKILTTNSLHLWVQCYIACCGCSLHIKIGERKWTRILILIHFQCKMFYFVNKSQSLIWIMIDCQGKKSLYG